MGRGTQQSKASRKRCFFCVVFPIQGACALLTLNSPFTVLKSVVSKNRTAVDFQNPKRNINGDPARYLYSWGGRLSISFHFNKNIKAPFWVLLFLKRVVSKTRTAVDFYIVYKKYISLANIFLI